MHLDEIEIINYQSHKHTLLKLHPKINVIAGSSDFGKSAIIRAIKWAVFNKPRGDAFKNWDSQPIDPCSVKLSFSDGSWGKRERTSTKNGYQLSDGSEFEAIRTDVPVEVSRLFNLDDTNIHGQNDTYFLLQGTSGEAAKRFNQVVNLEIIDQLLKAADSRTKAASKQITNLKTEINQINEELSQFPDLKKIEELVSKVVVGLRDFDKLADRSEKLQISVDAIQEIQKTKLALQKKWNPIENILDRMQPALEELQLVKSRSTALQTIVTNIEATQTKQEKLKPILDSEKALERLLTQSYENQRTRRDAIEYIIDSIEMNQQASDLFVETIRLLRIQLTEQISKAKVCPLCGGKVVKANLENHIGEWL